MRQSPEFGCSAGRGTSWEAVQAPKRPPEKETHMLRGLVGLLIVVAIVLFLVKVALFGGIVGAVALILLVLLLLGRL